LYNERLNKKLYLQVDVLQVQWPTNILPSEEDYARPTILEGLDAPSASSMQGLLSPLVMLDAFHQCMMSNGAHTVCYTESVQFSSVQFAKIN